MTTNEFNPLFTIGIQKIYDPTELEGLYEPIINPKNEAFNKNFGTEQGTVAQGNHSHSNYEPTINPKNTAFNKNFGTEQGTVAQGNHVHDFIEYSSDGTIEYQSPGGGVVQIAPTNVKQSLTLPNEITFSKILFNSPTLNYAGNWADIIIKSNNTEIYSSRVEVVEKFFESTGKRVLSVQLPILTIPANNLLEIEFTFDTAIIINAVVGSVVTDEQVEHNSSGNSSPINGIFIYQLVYVPNSKVDVRNGKIEAQGTEFNFNGSKILTQGESVSSADKLKTARQISFSGNVIGNASFDGSKNIDIHLRTSAPSGSFSFIADSIPHNVTIDNGLIKYWKINGIDQISPK